MRTRQLAVEQLERREVFSTTTSALLFTQQAPEGWVILDSQASGQLKQSNEMKYTANLTVGQPISFAVFSPNGGMTATLVDPNGAAVRTLTVKPNLVAYINPVAVSTGGTWSVVLNGATVASANYTLDVALNSGLEGKDSTVENPRPLNASLTAPQQTGVPRYAFMATSNTTKGADVDIYTVDLTNRVGKPVSIEITARDGQNLSGQTLELLAPNGSVKAIATPKAGQPGTLEIANFVVPADGKYTLRFTSSVSGAYSVVMTDGLAVNKISASLVVNKLVNDRLVVPTTTTALLNTLSFDRVFQSMNAEQVMEVLAKQKLVGQIGDAASLRAILASQDIDLNDLRPDGVLTALATLRSGSYLKSGSTTLDAGEAKTRLQTAFNSNKLSFLDVFAIDELVYLFDNSIASAAGVKADPFWVIVDKPVAPNSANLTQSYRLWVKEAGGPEVVTPAEALAHLKKMPVGYRTFFLTNFLEMPGFDGGLTEAAGYVDTKRENGSKTQYSLLWMDDWEALATTKLTNFLKEYKRLGGQLDYLVVDIEDTSFSYHSMIGDDRRVDKSKPATLTIWQELLSDARWPALKAQLVARGIPEADLTLSTISTWDVHSANAARWNAVMSERLADYLNGAITDTVLAYYPDAIVSNYGNNYHTQTIPARRYSQFNNSYFSLGPLVGNAQSQSMYGAYTDVTTPGTISGPNLQFDARIKNISFIQNTNSSGAKLPSGTAVVTFFEPINGIQVGDEIIVENRGVDWIDKKYTGEFKVSWISSDRKTIRYTLQLPDTKAPKTYDLSTRSQVELTAFVDFNRSYERFVGEVKALRSQVAASSATLLPWASNPDYREFINNFEWNHFSEVFFHAALSGADAILWWKAGFETQPENTAEMAKLVTEVNALIGYTGRETLSFDNPHWDDGYVLTGMEANGKRVYRFTPDPHLSMTILSNSGTVRIKIGDKTVEIPNASIYTPSSPASSLGLWIVQTKGSTSLNGAASQVLQALSASLAPSVTAPSAVMTGSPTDFVFRTDPSLVPAGTLIAYDVDWNGDGKTDRTYYGTNQVTATATWSSAGSWTVRVQASIVGTGEKLPLVEHSIRALTSGFSVETSTSDSPVKNLIYAGTSAGDTVYFKSAGNGVIDAIVINGSTTTTRTFTGINGAIYAYGLGGNDILVAADANVPAFLFGGEGNDLLIASTRSSQLFGENGDDTLVGMSGSTLFDGGAGKNTIQLGAGVSMVAEGGNDKILGGTNYISVPRESLNIFAQSLASVANRAAAAALPVATDVAQAASLPSARSSSVNKSVDSVFDEFDPFDDEDPFA